ncbi:MAG TPA: NUDIX domain-containing protein [bacterium]|nr:NUDIX domain-containing protein [bacterium]
MQGSDAVHVVAVCVVEKDGRVLLMECQDKAKGGTYYRPLGGRVGFGEPEQQTVRRAFREGIGAELKNLESYGQMESPFPLTGESGHEILIIFRGDLTDPALYEAAERPILEGGRTLGKAVWVPLKDLHAGKVPLYPEGLLELMEL